MATKPAVKPAIKYDQMSVGIIDESLKALKIDVPATTKTIPAKVQLLVKRFKADKSKMADCTVCGGSSDENFPKCPYCGDATFIEPGDVGAAAVNQAANHIIESAAPVKPKREKTKTGTPHLAIVRDTTAEVVDTDPATDPAYTEKDLDKAVALANKHKSKASGEIWAFGNHILDIHAKGLWRLRKDENGAPKFLSWNKFCKEELAISPSQSYRFMSVTKSFDQKTIEETGMHKLSIGLHQTDDERQRLLAEIKGGASHSQLEQQKRESRANNAGTRTPPVASDADIAKARDVAITVRAPKAIEIACVGVNNKGKPAKTLVDDPWCEEEHSNGVISRYAIKADPDTGVITLIITRRRGNSPTK